MLIRQLEGEFTMPATVTHAFFAKDVYDILPNDIQSLLDINQCKMFGQSTDSLLFYNLFSIFPGKKIRSFQRFFHSNQTQEFFINVLRYMKDNNINQVDAYSFLVGFICHYVLDSTLHPYIIYRSGVFDSKNPSTYRYNNQHAIMESYIDNDMIKRREDKNPFSFPITNYCFSIHPFSPSLKDLIDYSFYNTFQIQYMSKIYYKSLIQMKNSIRIFRMDRYGIKKNIYKLADTFTPRNWFLFEAISYHVPLSNSFDYLNLNHSLWRNPTTYSISSHESFVDLYLKSIKIAKVIICASFDYLNGKAIDLEQVFLNTSYVTGLDCNLNKKLKYFDF